MMESSGAVQHQKPSGERQSRAISVPFLSFRVVPEDLWQALNPSQRDLHLLWARKFAPLFRDYGRVRPDDVSDRDRRLISAVVEAISERRLRFCGPHTYVGQRRRSSFFLANADLLGERSTLKVLVTTSVEDTSDRTQWISLQAHGLSAELEVLLVWRSQADPERGSVLLFPQAASSKHQFAIAAFNHAQFRNICEALVEYLGGDPPASGPAAATDAARSV